MNIVGAIIGGVFLIAFIGLGWMITRPINDTKQENEYQR